MSILNETPQQETIAGLNGSPKTMFLLGLSVGIGSMAVIALIFMMMLFMQGTNVFAAGTNKTKPTNVAVTDPTAQDPSTDPTAQQPTAGPVPEVTAADHVKGPADAKVTLIEYSDFECPYCSKHEETITQLLKDYPKDVRLVYRHFPLSFHQNAQPAAVASECAGKQGKFWEMHEKLFADSEAGALSIEAMKKNAADLGLNTGDFNNCLDKNETLSIVEGDYNGGVSAGVQGTPGTFVNGKLVEGAVPLATFKQIIDAEIAK